jgi:FKBP-type peptidyl-prolyl cis-trans isomerase
LAFASCSDDSIYAGFKKTESGAYMQFYTTNEGQMPRLNDEVTFHMAQVFGDSLLFSSFGDEPMQFVLKKADFVGDVPDALLMMHVGDSARIVVPIDSVLITMLGLEEVPEEYAGKPIYYDLKLLSIRPFEELEAERRALLESMKQEEIDFLAPLVLDPNHTVTESGLIIMEKTGNGKVACLGDHVDFDFTMCSPMGDTIMNSFGVEPVEIQYGEEFLGKGFNEAIGMVPEGGTMRFVVPSELAFDSIGYEQFILPYTPLVVLMKMNSVMDEEVYDKHLADLEAEKEAEAERMMAAEAVRIANYVKANNIIETPTESGIYIIRQEEGEGNVAQWGDEVSVHYILSNLDGDVVDSS